MFLNFLSALSIHRGKIYGITEDDFERLFPFIKIPEKEPTKFLVSNENTETPKSYENTQKSKSFENNVNPKIEINVATPEEWQQLMPIVVYNASENYKPYNGKCRYRNKGAN